MKYFLSQAQRRETKSSCFYEFQKGRFSGRHWMEDSLCISDDRFDGLELYALFSKAVSGFDCCGVNTVRASQWEKLKQTSLERDSWQAVIAELTPWAEDSLAHHGEFTVCGL